MDKAIFAFFATITGAIVGFLGVLITLQGERKKAKEEREFVAKHKALLSAVETVTRFLNYYLTLPDRELPKDGNSPDELSEMAVSLNALHFYCNINTIKQSLAMGHVLSKSYTRVLKAKMPAMFIAEEIKGIDTQIAGMEKMNDQLQQEIIALLSADSSSPLLISHRQQLSANFKTIAGLYDKKVSLVKAKYHATEASRDAVVLGLREVYEAIRSTLLMARRELAFPIDEREYTAMLTQSTESALVDINSLLGEIRAEVAKRLQ